MMLRRLQFTVVLLYNVALTLAYMFNINHHKSQTHSKIITTSASPSTSITSLYAYSEQDAKNKQPIDDSVAKAANRNLETLLQDTFPRISYSSLYERESPDFSKLAPNDPFFLDMSWPTERGPESAAFAKHIQWKRRLSDGERIRWQKWAIYQRIMKKDMFKYRADDYIIQSLIKDLNLKAEFFKNNGHSRNNNIMNNNHNNNHELASTTNNLDNNDQQSQHNNNMNIESSLFKAAAQGLLSSDEEDIKAVMKSFYTILNHKNFEEIRTLWLPDAGVELIIPGYDRSKGHFEAEKSYRRLIHDSRPFGKINHNIVNVQCYGFIAIVYSVETIEKGSALRVAKKKPSAVLQSSSSSSSSSSSASNTKEPPVRILAVTVLRKFNQQWRIMQHHTSTYESSTATNSYPGEKVEIVDTFQRRMYSSSSSSPSSATSFSSPISTSSSVGVSSLSSSPLIDIASLINSNNINNNKVNKIKDNINDKQPPAIALSSSKLVDSVKTSDDVTANLWNQLKGFLDNDKLKSTAVTQVKPDGSVENIINFSSNSQLSSSSSAPLPLQSESSQAVYKTSANINLPTTNSNNNNNNGNNNNNKDNKSATTVTSMNEDIEELQRLKGIMMKIGDLETKISSAAANTIGGKNINDSNNNNGNNSSGGAAVDSKATNSDKSGSTKNSSGSSASTFIPKGSADGYEFKRDENNKLFLSKTLSEPIDISTTNMNDFIKTDSYVKATKELENKIQAGESFSSDMLWKSTSVTKKTIQALRYLEKTNQISKEDKNVLLMNIINCVSSSSSSSSSSPSSLYYDYDDSSTQSSSSMPTTPTPSSLVETSFDLLVMQNYHGSKSELYAWQPSSADGGMDDFLEQCTVLCQSFNTNNNQNNNRNSNIGVINGNSSSKNKISKNGKMNNSNSNIASSGSASNTLEKKKPTKSKSAQNNGIISINTKNKLTQQQEFKSNRTNLLSNDEDDDEVMNDDSNRNNMR